MFGSVVTGNVRHDPDANAFFVDRNPLGFSFRTLWQIDAQRRRGAAAGMGSAEGSLTQIRLRLPPVVVVNS